jgi:hypothetical protein
VFHPSPPLTDLEVARVQADAQRRIERLLRARGLLAAESVDPEPLVGHEGSAMPYLLSATPARRRACRAIVLAAWDRARPRLPQLQPHRVRGAGGLGDWVTP